MRVRSTSARRKIASATVVSLVVGTVVALSLNYDGVATADVELNDGGVWVSNNNELQIGRLNYPVQQIDASLAAASQNVDLMQRGDLVYMRDLTTNTMQQIDPAAVASTGGVTQLPAGADVQLGDQTVGVLTPRSGEYFVLGLDELSVLDEGTAEPFARLGPDAVHAVADDGTTFGLNAEQGLLLTLTPQMRTEAAAAADETDEQEQHSDPDGPGAADDDDTAADEEGTEPEPAATVAANGAEAEVEEYGPEVFAGADAQLTAVGDQPVVLTYREDGEEGEELQLLRPGEQSIDLSELEIDLGSAVLQAPSESGDSVLLASTDALVEVPLGRDDPVVHSVSLPGEPIQPVQVAGCVHGAWVADVPYHLKSCHGGDAIEQPVPETDGGADLTFRVNRSVVVLNDLRNGDAWMLEDTLILVDNWEDITPPQEQDEEEEESLQEIRDEVPLDREAENRDPNAQDDSFGVRAGRTVILPVLDNDSDPDGDLLTVSEFTDVPESFGVVEPILGGRALQIRMAPDASGEEVIGYTADDGRMGTDTARATVTVYPPAVNNPPEQVRDISAEMVSGATVEVNVLNDVRDPEGDPIFILSAASTDTQEVLATPNGIVTINDLGIATGQTEITVTVSDGQASTDIVIDLEVLPDGPHPPVAVFDFATAFVGETITVEPLANDLDPNGRDLRLSHVEAPEATSVVTDTDAGTFTFKSETAADYYLTYIVADDDGSSATGLIRISVIPETESAPVAVADTALLPPGGSVLVDVLENDFDPAGGVLAVQQIDIPSGYGLNVAILDHRLLRISSDRDLHEPVTIGYTISNGLESAEGEVLVLPMRGADASQPPIAVSDTARVRAGDHVTIPVLANDSHPNGLDFTLDADLVEEPEEGLMFTAGDVVRFQAPDTAQTLSAVYQITDETGQSHSATITVYVLARGDESNSPPVPRDVETRAFAGEQIRIPIDTYGIDPDGDSVQLLGQASSPELGRVTEVGSGYLDYQPFTDSTGTDSFTYAARDRPGAVATAEITVGVIPPPDTNRDPVAVPDEIEVRPGRQVQVDVLANDTDPDGDRLAFDNPGVVDDAGLDVIVRDATVVFTAPAEPGTYVVQYAVTDRHGGRDIGTLTITVDPEAPTFPPVAVDDVVQPSAIIGMQSISVAVLENDYDPDGSVDDLELSVPSGNPTAQLAPGGRELEIELTEDRQVVTYQITDEDDQSSYAFVEVPGTEDTGPVLRTDTPPIEVLSGERRELSLDDYVVAPSGDPIQLTDTSLVQATNSDGSDPVVDANTVQFTSAASYTGPATITFEVTDAADINDDDILTSVLTLEILVTSDENQPPVMRNGSLSMEAGGDSEHLELTRLAEDPDGEVYDLTFEIIDAPDGFDVDIEDNIRFVATAGLDTPRGSEGVAEIEVTDPDGGSTTGTITLTATGSTEPLITANDDNVGEVHQGQSTSVDVLDNDSNPFPGEPRTIVSASLEQGDASVSVDGEAISFTPGEDYVGRLSIVYTVADATDEPEREVQARVTAAVIGAPATPIPPRVESVSNAQVVLTWSPPIDNGSPITGYRVEADGVSQQCESTTCTITGLSNGTVYNFTVTAINDVGESEASPPSGEARPDVKPEAPAAPTVEFGDGELDLDWNEPSNDGTPITHYDVEISPGPGQATVSTTSHTWTGLTNGQSYTFRVRAINDAPDPGDWSAWSAAEVPSGPPYQPDPPQATRVDTAAGGQLQVSWSEPNTNGDSIDRYYLQMYRDGTAQPMITVDGGTRQRTVNVENAYDYTFTVMAENRSGESEVSGESEPVRSFGAPGRTSNVSAEPTGSNGQADVSYSAPNDNGQAISRYEYRLNGGSAQSLPSGGTITGLTNGQSYTVQVRACNNYCGDWSSSSSTFVTYGNPSAPSVSSSADGQRVTFTWSSPASSNGAAVTASRYRINGGSWQNVSDRNGSASVSGDWEQNHRIEVEVRNEHGLWSSSTTRNQRAEEDPTPDPSFTLIRDRSATGQSNCNDSSCAYLDVRYTDLPSANYTVTFTASTGWTFNPQDFRLGGDGRFDSHSYFGHPGATITMRMVGGGNTYTETWTW